MIPLKSEAVPYRFSYFTYCFIFCCCVIFFFQRVILTHIPPFIPLEFVYSIFHLSDKTIFMFLSLLFSFFMHGSLVHLASNMWYLMVFGNAVESTVGHRRFFFIYLICGVISMLCQAVSNPISAIPIVGASGAIAGIMGMYLVLLPFSRLNVWFPPLFIFRIPAFIFLLLWFALQYVSLNNSQIILNSNIAWWAHIGGFISGILLAIRNKKQKNSRRKKS